MGGLSAALRGFSKERGPCSLPLAKPVPKEAHNDTPSGAARASPARRGMLLPVFSKGFLNGREDIWDASALWGGCA